MWVYLSAEEIAAQPKWTAKGRRAWIVKARWVIVALEMPLAEGKDNA